MLVRRLLALSLLAVGLLGAPTPAHANAADDADMVRYINFSREKRGLQPVRVSSFLTAKARDHSQEMAAGGALWHSDISVGNGHWFWLGQNVGYGSGSVWRLHLAFMASPPHKANILKREANLVGVGTVRRGGLLWVTVNLEDG
jgi:uncharacterized protein YkwD